MLLLPMYISSQFSDSWSSAWHAVLSSVSGETPLRNEYEKLWTYFDHFFRELTRMAELNEMKVIFSW